MPSSLSTTLHSFFGGSGRAKQGDSLGGLLKKVWPIPGGGEEGPEDQFASWLPYSAYIPDERLFVNRETLGFMLEVVPQSGADERMSEILVSLYATCPPGTGIQWMLFGSPHVLDCLSQYGNLRVEDTDQAEKAKHFGRPARNTNLYRTLARRRVTHLLQGAHRSLTKGYHYTVRDFKLNLSVCVAGSIDNLTMRENLLLLRESISTTLRAASFPNRVCTADDLINWCALFTNPDRVSQTDAPNLHYDDGREIRDQIVAILDAERQPHQRVRDAERVALVARQIPVGHRRGHFDQRLDAAEARADVRNAHAVDEATGRIEVGFQLEGHYAAEAALRVQYCGRPEL